MILAPDTEISPFAVEMPVLMGRVDWSPRECITTVLDPVEFNGWLVEIYAESMLPRCSTEGTQMVSSDACGNQVGVCETSTSYKLLKISLM